MASDQKTTVRWRSDGRSSDPVPSVVPSLFPSPVRFPVRSLVACGGGDAERPGDAARLGVFDGISRRGVEAGARREVGGDVEHVLGAELQAVLDDPGALAIGAQLGGGDALVPAEHAEGLV